MKHLIKLLKTKKNLRRESLKRRATDLKNYYDIEDIVLVLKRKGL